MVTAGGVRKVQGRSRLARRLLPLAIVTVAACAAGSGAGACPVARAERPPSDAERIVKDGFHLKRIEGEPAKNPSFWTRRISFGSDFEPVKGVWLHARTAASVTIRWKGEYAVRSECGPYQLLLAARAPTPAAAVPF